MWHMFLESIAQHHQNVAEHEICEAILNVLKYAPDKTGRGARPERPDQRTTNANGH